VSAQIRLDAANLPEYLRKMGWVPEGEPLCVEPVGDGNINWVRRVRTAAGSVVVKQARPALERFPEYRVSTERIVFEARFYQAAAPSDVAGVCPRLLAFDAQQRVLLLEDLGDAERLDAALARGADVTRAAATLAAFLGRVHSAARGAGLAARFANDEMRRLHGDHVFVLPYRPNGFPLSPPVAARARQIQTDTELVGLIDAAHARYLAPGTALVHGDVQAANVLLAGRGPVLLDAEIAHAGDPAFDLGQLLAHLLLPHAARGRADTALPLLDAAWQAYREAAAAGPQALSHALRHAGIELLRRTIGAARVAAVERDEASLAVLDAGLALVRRPSRAALGSRGPK
jgi:5-methylthioribose kinase